MNFNQRLNTTISTTNSILCVGLDPDLNKIPNIMKSDSEPLYKFCAEIIEHTKPFCAAFKINFAFFEAEGAKGWEALARVVDMIPQGIIKIADAKRADIGNSSQKYAEAILQQLNFDVVTVNPYMGKDSVAPFIQWPEKGVFILAITSNPGSKHFQQLIIDDKPLYTYVIQEVVKWNVNQNCGLVVGATHPNELKSVREAAPNLPFLIPGVGAQGGDLEQAILHGTDKSGQSALINASRSIIYKSSGSDFAEAAAIEAERMNNEINHYRRLK